MKRIPVSGPWITQLEIDYVADAAANCWYENANMYNSRFEKAFADYMGLKHAVSLPSCTSAIHLALAALGVGPGHEVIVPDLTWIASAAPITYVGATTVFADVDSSSWCLSPESFEKCITPKTKAVIPVDIYGGVPDYDAIVKIADKHGIAVIEDAAEAMGSEYKNKKAGSLGLAGVFSFHGSKTMTTGEGGMLVTDDDKLHAQVLFLRDHGRKPGDVMFFNSAVAYKYKMSSMQAAMGLAQLERIDELVEKKRQVFSWYQENLGDSKSIILNHEPKDTLNTFWMVCAILDPGLGLKKEEFMEKMAEQNIDTRPFFHPLSSIPAFENQLHAKAARKENVNSYAVSPFGINLPCGMSMDEDKVNYVCDAVKKIVGLI